MEMANARIIETNAFMVLNNSFLTARMRLPDGHRVAVFAFSVCCMAKSKMTPSELSTGSALQISLERTRFVLRFERNSSFDSPWPVLRCVRTITPIVFKQALFKITCNSGVVNRWVCVTH